MRHPPVSLLLLVLQGSQRVLQAVRQDLQLLGQLVLLAELLAQQHQVARGVVQRDVAQVEASASQIVQVHDAGGEKQSETPVIVCVLELFLEELF